MVTSKAIASKARCRERRKHGTVGAAPEHGLIPKTTKPYINTLNQGTPNPEPLG